MTIRFKRNRSPACYYEMPPSEFQKPEPQQHARGPYESCGNCPYASHGFICHSSPGDCLRTDMEKINRRQNADRTKTPHTK
ncbi:MAG: hypothetical protein PHE09_00435 [Oscillospiraceae bacterium]|nr:hypothetical protein [Oscillospiraceae bacterium]